MSELKIVIMSDSHGNNGIVREVLEMEKPDMLIHCGDVERDWSEIEKAAGSPRTPVIFAVGNCDNSWEINKMTNVKPKAIYKLRGHQFLVTHGHRYGVSYGLETINLLAQENQCDIVCFGHTHTVTNVEYDGIHFLNPGSISRPRGATGKSYMIMRMEDDGTYTVELKEIS